MRVPWTQGAWSNAPAAVEPNGDDLLVTAVESSDAWRHTAYGYVHASEHALLAAFRPDSAVEVEFTAALTEQFDQAGLFLRASDERWVKATAEYADGELGIGAVVTDGNSDWSVSPAPDLANQRVVFRASWSGDAVTVRAGRAGQPLRLLRVLPFASTGDVTAGPLVCAPSRAGLTVRFHAWRTTPPDQALHDSP